MKRRVALLFFMWLFIVGGMGKVSAEIIESRYGKLDKTGWNQYVSTTSRFTCPEDFLLEIDDYAKGVCNYLQIDFAGKIRFIFSPGRTGGAISLQKQVLVGSAIFNIDEFPFVHEITHVIAPSFSPALQEGLAEVMEAKFAKRPCDMSMGYQIHSVASIVIQHVDPDLLKNLLSIDIDYTSFDQINMVYFYTLSESLTSFLLNEYGVAKFMEYYSGNEYTTSFSNVFGKNEEKMITEWTDFLKTQPPCNIKEWANKIFDYLYKIQKEVEKLQ